MPRRAQHQPPKPSLLKRVLISAAWGAGIFIVSWFHINSYHSLGIEDDLFHKVTFYKYEMFGIKPKTDKDVIFINTGKDLKLIDNPDDQGNIAVSDRYKLLQLLKKIPHDTSNYKPSLVVLDLLFFYPYASSNDDSIRQAVKTKAPSAFLADTGIDSAIQAQINQHKELLMSATLDTAKAISGKGAIVYKIKRPIYKNTRLGIVDYTTYGNHLNKFRVNYDGWESTSLPAIMLQKTDSGKFSGGNFATFYKGKLCFNYLWPSFYYDEAGISDPAKAGKHKNAYQAYTIGSLLTILGDDPHTAQNFFKNKIVMVGNFNNDIHDTPRGPIPGTIIIWDIYLSLLNNTQFFSIWWLILLAATFSILSYCALYARLPRFKYKGRYKVFKVFFSFFENVSYVLILTALSIVSIWWFNVPISIALPAFILFLMEQFVPGKNLPEEL